MDGLPHGLEEKLVIGVKAPMGVKQCHGRLQNGMLAFLSRVELLPLSDVSELHALFQQGFLVLQENAEFTHPVVMVAH